VHLCEALHTALELSDCGFAGCRRKGNFDAGAGIHHCHIRAFNVKRAVHHVVLITGSGERCHRHQKDAEKHYSFHIASSKQFALVQYLRGAPGFGQFRKHYSPPSGSERM
jgi:hypothetical protein